MSTEASGKKKSNTAAFVLFAVILIGAGAFMFLWGGSQRTQAAVSADWPTAPGTVLESEVEVIPGTPDLPTDSYQPLIRYSYVVDGQEYLGSRVSFGLHDSRDREEVESTVAEYPVGGTIDVAYDPEKPSESVLEPGDAGNNLRFQLMGAGLLLVGLVLIVVPIVLRARRRR